MKKSRLPLLLLTVLTCSGWWSCKFDEQYYRFHSFREAQWDKDETVRFEVPIDDPTKNYDLFLDIRNNNRYPYSNLWLFIDVQLPDGTVRSDTLEIRLADVYGKWYGKGLSLFTLSAPYKTDLQYPESGTYIYTIRQGMRTDLLTGISDIGIRIVVKK